MARIHGQKGRLYVGLASSTAAAEPVAFLNSISMEFSTDKAEVTSFEDANKIYVNGKNDVSGSFSGFFDNATAQLYTAANDGDKRRFYFYPDATVGTAGPYWYGEGIFDFSVSVDAGDAAKVSGSYTAASDIAKTG